MIQLLCNHYISLKKEKLTGAVSLGADMAGMIDMQQPKQGTFAKLISA
jgi:hypothetical protein